MTQLSKTRDRTTTKPLQTPPWKPSPRVCAVIIFFVLALFVFIRVRLRNMPLERDEGEYAYAGQLILQGIPPYKLAYNMKLPGTYGAYAIVLFLFGQTSAAVHTGLLLVNAATTILMFFLARRLFGEIAGVTAAAAYALISCGTAILGLQAHATHFVVLAAVAGLLLLATDQKPRTLFWAGTLFGLAFLMKQPGIVFGMFAVSYIAFSNWRSKQTRAGTFSKVGALLLGSALPFAMTCIILLWCGVFGRFWFWTFDYARAYASATPLGEGIDTFAQVFPKIVGPAIGIWGLAALSLAAFEWDKSAAQHRGFGFGLLAFSFLGACPGLYFRPHYFILMLPAVALLAAVTVSSATRLLLRPRPQAFLAGLPALVFLGAFGYAIAAQSDVFFEMDPTSVSRYFYGDRFFADTLVVSDYVKSHTNSASRIAMLGSEPEVYFYSQRHSVTGYIYAYPLGEDQPYAKTMQAEMIKEIEVSRPDYLVVHTLGWIMPGYRGFEERAQWLQNYEQNYELVGLGDRLSSDHTEFRWGADARAYTAYAPILLVFRRKT